MLISVGYLLCTIAHKIRKIRSHFPSVSFDLIKIGDTISEVGMFLSCDYAIHLTQHDTGLVCCRPAASCSTIVGCSGGTSFASLWQSFRQGYSPGTAAAHLKWKYQQQKVSLCTGHIRYLCFQIFACKYQKKHNFKKPAHLKDTREESGFSNGRH